MKIALVGLTHPFRGGISHYTTLLCRALREQHEVVFFSLSRQYPRLLFPGKTQLDQSSLPFQVKNEPCLDSINPLTWFETGRRIREFGPDLVLFSWWHPFFAPAFGSVARLAGGAPCCFLCHNVLPHESSLIDRLLLRYVFSSGAAFITHSVEDAANLRLFAPRAPVRRNPHPSYGAFATERVPDRGDARRALGLADRRLLLFFGFVRAYKGLDVLLDAVLQLAPEEGYHLLVVGEFYEDPSKYQSALDALKARDQVTLVDRYVGNEEIPDYFAAADLVVVPYLSATQSGIVQMAYGFGKPVIATSVGGLPEVVADGRTGYLVPPSDPAAIAQAARRYFQSDDRRVFSENIAHERENYSWERMVATISDLMLDLAPAAKAAGR